MFLTRSATWFLWDCMFWRCRVYSWLERAVVTFHCQPVALRGTVLTACDARYCDTYVTTFRRNLLPPPSEWKCKQREERRPMLFGFWVTCFTFFTSRYVIFFLSFYLWSLFKDHKFPIIFTVPIDSFLVLPFLPSLSLPTCGLFFCSEDWGSKFLRNVDSYLPNYTAPFSRHWYL